MKTGHLLKLLCVVSSVVNGILGYTTCLSCTGVIRPRDCNTIERCGPFSTCFTDSLLTQIGTLRYNLGCRDVKQCSGYGRDRKRDTNAILCSECCTGDLCNSMGCHQKGYPPLGFRGPVCFNCPDQTTVNDCNLITVCGLGEICHLRRTIHGSSNDIRYETMCQHFTKCKAEVDFYKPGLIGRRDSQEFSLGSTCMVQCCTDDLCNVGCIKNTTSYSSIKPSPPTIPSTIHSTLPSTVLPSAVTKPKIDIFVPNQATVFYQIGSKVVLKCGSTSLPVPSVTWSRMDGTSVAVVQSGTVTLSSLQPSQLGSYTCTAKNVHGTTSKTITIVSNTTGVLDCAFERLGTCLWTNNDFDNGEWLNSGVPALKETKPNINIGPRNLTGSFLFISKTRGLSDRVVDLISPELGPSDLACFSFLFELFRDSVQYLQVEVVADCDSYSTCKDSVPKTVILHGTSTKPQGWRFAQIELPPVPHNHRLVIKSIHRPGALDSDYCAIDNLRYYSGKCKTSLTLLGFPIMNIAAGPNTTLWLTCAITGDPTPTYHWYKLGGCGEFDNATGATALITSHAAPGDSGTYACIARNTEPDHRPLSQTFHVTISAVLEKMCTFQHGLCGWTQETDDDFDWLTNNGPTISQNTGPDADHTLGQGSGPALGNYLYTEASSPRSPGHRAVLRSQRLLGNQSSCFSFYYHMYGNEIGQLSVTVQDTCTLQHTDLFTKHGDQGNQWLFDHVNIPAQIVPNDYHVIITGTLGSSYHGDIAIDDLLIKTGTCV